MTICEKYMQRCLELASLGRGNVAPNPMVGCVVVYNGKIIGEGYHRKYGGPHAEVNAINSVKDKSLLEKSEIYVSLEPCAHFGKTPPCADLIIKHKIPKVYVGVVDTFSKVSGKGIQKLRDAGIEVTVGILEEECRKLNQRFFTTCNQPRPYIILKWAQNYQGVMGVNQENLPINQRFSLPISNKFAHVLSHKLRAEESAILVGKNTVENDNPNLDARLYFGQNPLRIVIDRHLTLTKEYNIFNQKIPTFVFNCIKDQEEINLKFIKLEDDENFLENLLTKLQENKIQSLIVEGGAYTLSQFISKKLYDEIIIFENKNLTFDLNDKNLVFAPDTFALDCVTKY